MSRNAINALLGKAMIDDHFARKLLAEPLKTALESGFDLTPKERSILQRVRAKDLAELGQLLLEHLEDEEQKNS